MQCRFASRLLLVLCVGWILACCHEPPLQRSSPSRSPGGSGQVFRIAIQSPESLDPAFSRSYSESELVLQLFDGLLRFSPDLSIAPALAENWQVSPDGKTYTFHLRQGVRFHNGREVVAEDFVYSLTRLLDPRLNSLDGEQYSMIQGAGDFQNGRSSHVGGLTVLNRYTLQIRLEKAYAPFLRILAQQSASVVPKEAVEDRNVPFARHPLGTGAFRLREWRSGDVIILEANPAYFDGPPHLGEIIVKPVSPLNAEENYGDFVRSNVDISFVPSSRVTEVQARKDWIYWNRPVLRFMYLGFNLNAPLPKERAFRKAVGLALNRQELIGSDADYSALYNLLPLSLLGSSPGRLSGPFDPSAAREALEPLRDRYRTPLRVGLWHATVSQERETLLLELARSLKAVGIEVELKIEPSLNALLGEIYGGRTQMFLLGEVFDFPEPGAVLNRLFHSKSKGNPFAYRNLQVDQVLEEAQTLLDEGQRAALYGRIERQILNDYVLVPLFQVNYSVVTRGDIEGIELGPLGFQYLPFRKIRLRPGSIE
jgi:oligopeptide transport system substrate-binding protein